MIEYRVTWREFTGYKDGEPKEILFLSSYSRNPEQDALGFVEELQDEARNLDEIGREVGDIKIQRRVVSDWMECIGV
jgi:hypothetical protein